MSEHAAGEHTVVSPAGGAEDEAPGSQGGEDGGRGQGTLGEADVASSADPGLASNKA